ncbi:MAG: exodeoxyribonuclease VII large subunit [Kordiimonadaceae bacterium]|nr:exodeoxyribonuclease VII large subunit [Kordiimonadaceae bacterium]
MADYPPTDADKGTNTQGSNAHEFTVSEISGALKRAVEDQFGYVRVRAELSGVKRAASGHLYFSLKDDKAVMDGICWRGSAARLTFNPEDGLEVVCSGKLTTYPGRSKYQMVVDRMEPAGAGALMALLEERKKKLSAEGLFDSARKKALPYIPKVIGVVTSPTGAVIRDILHRLQDRFPRQVVVWPVIVQGEGAADKIAAAIRGFNALDGTGSTPRPDLLIVARGGGSIEDLWAFNEEIVVRAAAESDIPLISAVGHETDTTLIDYASDLRAPTPTGAAEMAVPVREDLSYTIADLGRRLAGLRQTIVRERVDRVQALARALPKPKDLLGLASQRFDELADRLPRGLMNVSQQKTIQFNKVAGGLSVSRLKQTVVFRQSQLDATGKRIAPAYARKLETLSNRLVASGRMLGSLSYERVLERGFALVEDADGRPVSMAADLAVGEHLQVRFADGKTAVEVLAEGGVSGQGPQEKTTSNKQAPKKQAQKNPTGPKKAKPAKNDPSNDRQGSLL